MAQRFAGIAFLMVDGNQLALRGNFTVSPASVERTMIAGQDRVHGYQELPRVPYIEGDISTIPEINLEDLEAQTNVTVVAQLANNKQYTLAAATCKAGFEANTRYGQVRVRWEGLWCEEVQL
jgi:Phage tail tube protein